MRPFFSGPFPSLSAYYLPDSVAPRFEFDSSPPIRPLFREIFSDKPFIFTNTPCNWLGFFFPPGPPISLLFTTPI